MSRLEFRDPVQGEALFRRLERAVHRVGQTVTVMHVCGSHEQAMARYGLRTRFPELLRVVMGPGCPVCVTDAPEIDACVDLARRGVRVLTYGDMLRVPGSRGSLDDARAEGAQVEVVYSALQAVEKAKAADEPLVFFSTGFETTAVATAALLLKEPPEQLTVFSAHKWVPAAMEVVASTPESKIQGFLAAGHAATITGYGIFEPFVDRHRKPVVVAGFEPLDILAGLCVLVEHVERGEAQVTNAFPRCVTRSGNAKALEALFRVFELSGGEWRGIAHIPSGSLELRPEFDRWNAKVRFGMELSRVATPSECRCGAIMSGLLDPSDCAAFGKSCRPESPQGACMVSSEGACRIWLEHGLGGRR